MVTSSVAAPGDTNLSDATDENRMHPAAKLQAMSIVM